MTHKVEMFALFMFISVALVGAGHHFVVAYEVYGSGNLFTYYTGYAYYVLASSLAIGSTIRYRPWRS